MDRLRRQVEINSPRQEAKRDAAAAKPAKPAKSASPAASEPQLQRPEVDSPPHATAQTRTSTSAAGAGKSARPESAAAKSESAAPKPEPRPRARADTDKTSQAEVAKQERLAKDVKFLEQLTAEAAGNSKSSTPHTTHTLPRH